MSDAKTVIEAAKKGPTREEIEKQVIARMNASMQDMADRTAKAKASFLDVKRRVWEVQYPNHPYDPAADEAAFAATITGKAYGQVNDPISHLKPELRDRMVESLRKAGVSEDRLKAALAGQPAPGVSPEETAAKARFAEQEKVRIAKEAELSAAAKLLADKKAEDAKAAADRVVAAEKALAEAKAALSPSPPPPPPPAAA